LVCDFPFEDKESEAY